MTKIQSLLSAYRKQWILRSGIALALIAAWLWLMQPGDAYFVPFILCGLLGLAAFVSNVRQPERERSKRKNACCLIFPALFSAAVILADYRVVSPVKSNLLKILVLFIGGFVVGRHILTAGIRLGVPKGTAAPLEKGSAARWFWGTFLSCAAVWLIVLFFCYRPGILSPDSVQQIRQNMEGVWSNHHPYWHTMVIKVLMDAGMAVFHDINAGVLVYSVFQVLCMAAIFAYLCMTMAQAGIRKGFVIAAAAAFALLPYHVLFSFTMWKDVPFGGAVALFLCALYRELRGIGKKGWNLFILVLSTLMICLFRSNGMVAFILMFLAMIPVMRRTGLKTLAVLLCTLVFSFVMKHPVLKALNVSQPDIVEFLSIPEQQFARLIVEDVPLEEDERAQIEKLMDPAQVKERYKAYLADPVKGIIRSTGLKELEEHKWDYLKLWLRLGLKHPLQYINAWVDQTRGYWNGGYSYPIVRIALADNEYGMEMPEQDNLVARITRPWVDTFSNSWVFEVFRCIGFHVWAVLLCGIVCFVNRRKEGLLAVLPLAVVLTLLISTPVFNEFRYAYAVFAPFPLILLATFAAPARQTE